MEGVFDNLRYTFDYRFAAESELRSKLKAAFVVNSSPHDEALTEIKVTLEIKLLIYDLLLNPSPTLIKNVIHSRKQYLTLTGQSTKLPRPELNYLKLSSIADRDFRYNFHESSIPSQVEMVTNHWKTFGLNQLRYIQKGKGWRSLPEAVRGGILERIQSAGSVYYTDDQLDKYFYSDIPVSQKVLFLRYHWRELSETQLATLSAQQTSPMQYIWEALPPTLLVAILDKIKVLNLEKLISKTEEDLLQLQQELAVFPVNNEVDHPLLLANLKQTAILMFKHSNPQNWHSTINSLSGSLKQLSDADFLDFALTIFAHAKIMKSNLMKGEAPWSREPWWRNTVLLGMVAFQRQVFTMNEEQFNVLMRAILDSWTSVQLNDSVWVADTLQYMMRKRAFESRQPLSVANEAEFRKAMLSFCSAIQSPLLLVSFNEQNPGNSEKRNIVLKLKNDIEQTALKLKTLKQAISVSRANSSEGALP